MFYVRYFVFSICCLKDIFIFCLLDIFFLMICLSIFCNPFFVSSMFCDFESLLSISGVWYFTIQYLAFRYFVLEAALAPLRPKWLLNHLVLLRVQSICGGFYFNVVRHFYMKTQNICTGRNSFRQYISNNVQLSCLDGLSMRNQSEFFITFPRWTDRFKPQYNREVSIIASQLELWERDWTSEPFTRGLGPIWTIRWEPELFPC